MRGARPARRGLAGPGRSGVTGLEAARPLLPARGAVAEGPRRGAEQGAGPGNRADLGRGAGAGTGAAPGAGQNGRQCPRCLPEGTGRAAACFLYSGPLISSLL